MNTTTIPADSDGSNQEQPRARKGGAMRRWIVIAFVLIVALFLVLRGRGPTGDEAPTPSHDRPTSAGTPRSVASPIVETPPAPTPTATLPPGSTEIRLVEPTPTATPAAFRSDTAELGAIIWATAIDPQSKAPTAIVTDFPANAPVIYATIPIARLTAGTELDARWSYNNTPLDGFVTRTVASRDESNIWAEFHLALTGSETWPAGIYRVEILADGQPALTAEVTVRTIEGT